MFKVFRDFFLSQYTINTKHRFPGKNKQSSAQLPIDSRRLVDPAPWSWRWGGNRCLASYGKFQDIWNGEAMGKNGSFFYKFTTL